MFETTNQQLYALELQATVHHLDIFDLTPHDSSTVYQMGKNVMSHHHNGVIQCYLLDFTSSIWL